MKNTRLSKFTHTADLFICSVWLLLVTHEYVRGWMNSIYLLLPALRIWIGFLMKRQSKQMIVPMLLYVLSVTPMFFERAYGYLLFIGPWETLLTSTCALFCMDSVYSVEFHELLSSVCKNVLGIVGFAWLVIYPLLFYICKRVKRQLVPGSMSVWRYIGLCAYIFGCAVVFSIVVRSKITLGLAVLAFMLMLIPVIFSRSNLKGMFTRGEVAYLLTLAMFLVGYICGIGLELKSVITVCTLPVAFYVLANWYIHRETSYKDILLVVGASQVFWCAQYTTNMVRISLLLLSLALMAVAVIRFAVETKKNWASAGLYVMIALVMPVFCLGYNPYSVLEAGRAWHFDEYRGSKNGILCVRAGDTVGLRDRYGVILPTDRYCRIELLTPSKPYCKVEGSGMWQIYDIERQELVSDEWFEDVIPCDEYVYRLKTHYGDKYLSLRWYYNPDGEQMAKIVDELPTR